MTWTNENLIVRDCITNFSSIPGHPDLRFPVRHPSIHHEMQHPLHHVPNTLCWKYCTPLYYRRGQFTLGCRIYKNCMHIMFSYCTCRKVTYLCLYINCIPKLALHYLSHSNIYSRCMCSRPSKGAFDKND